MPDTHSSNPLSTAPLTVVCESGSDAEEDLYIRLPFIRTIKKFNTCENVPPPNAFTTKEEIRDSFKVGLVCL